MAVDAGTAAAESFASGNYLEVVSMSGLQVDFYNDYIGGCIAAGDAAVCFPLKIAAVVLETVLCPGGVVGRVIDGGLYAGEGIVCHQRSITHEADRGKGRSIVPITAIKRVGVYYEQTCGQCYLLERGALAESIALYGGEAIAYCYLR